MDDQDATVRLRLPAAAAGGATPPPPPPAASCGWRAGKAVVLGGAFLGFAALTGVAVLFWDGPTAPPMAPGGLAPPVQETAPAPPAVLPLLSEAEILLHRATAPTMLRLHENPFVFVLDFPDLETQGAALNRVAALVEKRGLPRDRVLTDAELAAEIARAGDTPATYYFGHDYRGSDLSRFFALAERDGIALNLAEAWVREQLHLAQRLAGAGQEVALISIPATGQRVDLALRQTILRHEIGHGHYFTRPVLAAHVARVWRQGFTESDRAAFRAFLDREGYDPADEAMMMNETMAYLLFTPDRRIFDARHVGMTEDRIEALRALLRDGLPLH